MDFESLTGENYQIKLKSIIEEMGGVKFESYLLRKLYDVSPGSLEPLSLYQYHFALFYLLYTLQDHYYKQNKFLHVHFMRTSLSVYPAKGFCRHFDEYRGLFCSLPSGDDDYCSCHRALLGENGVDGGSIKSFYFDKNNFYKLDEKKADDFVNGTWEILGNYDKIKDAVKLLELPSDYTIEMVKTNYKRLAKIHHPDMINSETDNKFSKINDAYNLLIDIRCKI